MMLAFNNHAPPPPPPLVFTGYSDTGTLCDSTERKHRTFCRTHIISGSNHSCHGLALISFTMSTLTTNIILHPRVNQSLAILATTVGRDKVRQQCFAVIKESWLIKAFSWYTGNQADTVPGSSYFLVFAQSRPHRIRFSFRRAEKRACKWQKR